MYLVCDRDGICGSEMSHCLDIYAIADSLVEQALATPRRKWPRQKTW